MRHSLAASFGVLALGALFLLGGSAQATPIPAGLSLWLDASDPATIVTDGSGLIQQWSDKSPNGFNATQSDPTKRPALNATAVNGHPAVRFDGANDGLVIADGLSVSRPYTMFIVNQYYGSPQGRTLQSRDTNWLVGLWGGKNGYYAAGWVSDSNANIAGTGNPAVAEAVGTASNTNLFLVNGANKTVMTVRSGAPARLGLVGGGLYNEQSKADVAEVLVYNRVLSFEERATVGEYLASKYGLSTAHAANLAKVHSFTGADVGEGLDLQGTFRYAVNAGGPQVAVGGLTFTPEASTPGVSLVSEYVASPWGTRPEYGTTPADDGLESVMHSIRWSSVTDPPAPINDVAVDLDVVPGARYHLQLLFSENLVNRPPGSRVMDVSVEGQQVYDELDLNDVMGQFASAPTRGVVYAQELVARDNKLNILLGGATSGTDRNPILNAFTLEDLSTRIGTFTGGDPGEGLDLQGRFVYAVNVRGPGGFQIGDAQFTADNAPGVSVTAENAIDTWFVPYYGDTADDNNLETVMRSLRWTATGDGGVETLAVDLAGLQVGDEYKLQLLFAEGCCNRGFNVFIEDGLAARNFSPFAYTGVSTTRGVVLSHQFVALDGTLNIVLDGAGTPFGDKNPILQGFTLELVPEPATLALFGLGALALVRRRRP